MLSENIMCVVFKKKKVEESDPPSGYYRRRLNVINRTEPNRYNYNYCSTRELLLVAESPRLLNNIYHLGYYLFTNFQYFISIPSYKVLL